MMAAHDRRVLIGLQHHRDDRAETAVAKHGDSRVARDTGLLEDFAGGGDRLGKDRDLVGHRIGHREQIAIREAQVLGEASVAPENPEHGAIRAMTFHRGEAEVAAAASGVDLTDHAPSGQPRVRALDHLADELMPEHAAIRHVAAREFQVGAADPGHQHLDDTLAGTRLRDRDSRVCRLSSRSRTSARICSAGLRAVDTTASAVASY